MPFLATAFFLAGCNHVTVIVQEHPNEWFLESYSTKDGYSFLRNTVRYQAHCRGMFSPVPAKDGLDISSGFVPIPAGASGDSSTTTLKPDNFCTAILPYIGKTVPLEQHGDILVYREHNAGPYKDWITELAITEAK